MFKVILYNLVGLSIKYFVHKCHLVKTHYAFGYNNAQKNHFLLTKTLNTKYNRNNKSKNKVRFLILKIRSYLLKVRTVFDMLDNICKKTFRCVVVGGLVVSVSVSAVLVNNTLKAEGKETDKTTCMAITEEKEDTTYACLYNVNVPEINVDTLAESSIVEEVFLADSSSDLVSVDLSSVHKEPEAKISSVATNYVAAPVYTTKVVSYTEADYQALLRIVEAEATGCDIVGKILVANVIINRVNSSKFPNTISGVIFSPNQFSPINDGRYYSVTVKQTTIEAVDRALNGEDYSQGALFFASVSCVNSGRCWAANHYKRYFEHDGHVFFGL